MPVRYPACNPCRTVKVACDHIHPVCSRCQDRNQPSECIYRSRPFKKRKASTAQISRSPLMSEPVSAHDPDEQSLNISQRNGPKYPNPGYLGPSSHAAFFRQIVPDDVHDLTREKPENNLHARHFEVSHKSIAEGARVLGYMAEGLHLAACGRLVDEWISRGINFALAGDFTFPCVTSILQAFEPHEERSQHRFETLSRQIFHQTAQPLVVDSSTSLEDYQQLICLHNSRWETFGLGFTAIARATIDVRTFGDLYTSDRQRREVQRRAMHFSDLCLDLCLSLDCLNDLQLWLQYENFILHSQIDGDQSYHSWKKLGDVASSVFALGYHDQIGQDDLIPVFLTELRRAAFARAFSADKNVSIFLGRPPRINGRYCRFQLPGSAFREWALAASDHLPRSFQWNPADNFDYAADTRWSALCAVLKEEILGLFKENNPDVREQKARLIRADADMQWQALPAKFRLEVPLKLCKRSPIERDLVVTTRLNHLHVLFLLRLALLRRSPGPDHELIDTSFGMLSLVLEAAMLKNHLANSGTSMVWKVAYYGLAAAGFLCICLLNGTFESTATVSFSRVFQSLSVLVTEVETGALVQFEDANYALLARAVQTIKSLLDRLAPLDLHLTKFLSANEDVASDDTGSRPLEEWDPWTSPSLHDFESDFWFNLAEHPFLTDNEQVGSKLC